MDTGVLIGFALAWGFPIGVLLMGGNIMGFASGHATLIVFGGILGITILSFPLTKVFGIPKMLGKLLFPSLPEPIKTVQFLKQCSDRARKEGILSLENLIPQIDDTFLKKALRMAVDGIDPSAIKETLSTEIAFMEERHAKGHAILENIGSNGPAFAMLGTLIGMVEMMAHMEDPKTIGPNMATALLATLYGAFLAYTTAFPMMNRLKDLHGEEVLNMELVIEGVMAITSGDNPRFVEQRLLAFLPPSTLPEAE
jgi:chemotaxis protein MotA